MTLDTLFILAGLAVVAFDLAFLGWRIWVTRSRKRRGWSG